MKTVYFQNHVLALSFNRELQMGFAEWSGFLSSQEFKEATTKCLELIQEERLTRWLADNRKMKAIRQVDQQWFVENIMPQILQSTLQRMATLVSDDIFNQMAVAQMLQKIGNLETLTLQDFNDEVKALAWLSEPLSTAQHVG